MSRSKVELEDKLMRLMLSETKFVDFYSAAKKENTAQCVPKLSVHV